MISQFQFQEMQARLSKPRVRAPSPNDVEDEIGGLHYPIIKWCKEQFPQVPYIHARTDRKSTIGAGAPDFSLFYKGKAILIECKTRTGKQSPEQLGWQMLAEQQKFKVHVVRSMEEFKQVIQSYECEK